MNGGETSASTKSFSGEVDRYAAPLGAAFGISFLITAWGYTGTCHFPFVFDDLTAIVNNSAITNFDAKGLRGLIDFGAERVLGLLSFVMSWQMGGGDPCSFRKTNILIHAIAGGFCGMSALNLLRLGGFSRGRSRPYGLDFLVAMGAAGLFAAHPIQTQAVTYIYQRLASLTGLFGLAGFSFLTLWFIRPVSLFWWVAFVCTALAMITKQNAAMLPVLFLLAFLVFKKSSDFGSGKGRWSELLRGLAPFFVLPAVIPLLMLLADGIGNRISSHGMDGLGPLQYFLTQGRVIWKYIFVIIWPPAQSVDHVLAMSAGFSDRLAWFGIFGWVCVMTIIIVAIRSMMIHRSSQWLVIVAFGFCWFFVNLFVESSVIPIRDLMMEHRIYLPFAGLCWAFIAGAALVFRYFNLSGRRLWLASGSCMVLLVALASVAEHRNRVWESSGALWSSVLKTDPDSVRARLNLGNAFLREGKYEDALGEFSRLAHMLDHSTSLNKQAVARELPFQNVMALILSRRFEEARIALDKIEVSMEGLSERKAYTLAFLSWAQGEYRSALSQLDIFSFEGGLWRDATMLRVRAAGRLAADPSLSESDRSRFRFDQRENLEKILQRQPNDPEAVVRLARLMASSGLGAAAQDLLAVASAAAGDSFSPWYSVISAELLEDTQRYEAAMDRYRQALSRFPRHSGLRIWMGSFLALLGDQDSIHQLIGGSKDVDALADDGLELAKRLAGSFQFEEAVILLRRTLRLCESGARRCSRIPDLSEALAKYLLLMNPAASDEAEAFLARSRSINPDPQ